MDEKILPKLATEADVVKHAFSLLEQCSVLNLNSKKFIHVKVANPQEDSMLGDAIFNLGVTIATEGEKSEPTVSFVTKTPSTPTNLTALTAESKTKQFDVKVTLFNTAEMQEANEETIQKVYRNLLQAAHKDDQLSSALVHAVESDVLAKLAAEEASPLKQLVASKAGVGLALAVESFLQESKKQEKDDVKEEEVQHQAADAEPSAKQTPVVKKEFRKLIVTASNIEEVNLLLRGARSILNN